MSYGLEVRNAAEELVLRVTDPAWRLIYRRRVTAGSSGSHPLPGYNQYNAYAYVVGNSVFRQVLYASMAENEVTWSSVATWSSSIDGDLVVLAKA